MRVVIAGIAGDNWAVVRTPEPDSGDVGEILHIGTFEKTPSAIAVDVDATERDVVRIRQIGFFAYEAALLQPTLVAETGRIETRENEFHNPRNVDSIEIELSTPPGKRMFRRSP